MLDLRENMGVNSNIGPLTYRAPYIPIYWAQSTRTSLSNIVRGLLGRIYSLGLVHKVTGRTLLVHGDRTPSNTPPHRELGNSSSHGIISSLGVHVVLQSDDIQVLL